MASQPTPPKVPPPPRNKALLRPYSGKAIVKKPLIRPYFWGGGTLGGIRLTSHDYYIFRLLGIPKTPSLATQGGGAPQLISLRWKDVPQKDGGHGFVGDRGFRWNGS